MSVSECQKARSLVGPAPVAAAYTRKTALRQGKGAICPGVTGLGSKQADDQRDHAGEYHHADCGIDEVDAGTGASAQQGYPDVAVGRDVDAEDILLVAALDGVFAMELLINELLKRGGQRGRFEAKLFGGARIQIGAPLRWGGVLVC